MTRQTTTSLVGEAGQAENWDGYGGEVSSGASTMDGAARSICPGAGFVNDTWAIGGVSIKPSSGPQYDLFQDGDANGYSGTVDTFINAGATTADNSSNVDLQVDLDDGIADPTTQTLIRFDSLFGDAAGQIPIDAYITSASLTVNVNNESAGDAVIGLYPMLTTWADTDNWDSMLGGVSLDGVEAAVAADSVLSDPDRKRQCHVHRSRGPVAGLAQWHIRQQWVGGRFQQHKWLGL